MTPGPTGSRWPGARTCSATRPGRKCRRGPGTAGCSLGLACFVEPTGYGTATFGKRKMSIVPGYERATIRMDPSGSVIVMVGTHSHGQGHATTYAQSAPDALGIDPGRVR